MALHRRLPMRFWCELDGGADLKLYMHAQEIQEFQINVAQPHMAHKETWNYCGIEKLG